MNTRESPLQPIKLWYDKSKIDYVERYVQLYISYATWFRAVTGGTTDREAIEKLKKRFSIWDEYYRGTALTPLRSIMQNIVTLNEGVSPFDTILKDSNDWRNIIELWYEIRCRIFHGEFVLSDDRSLLYIKLAYESLFVFMSEIIDRMERTFDHHDERHLYEIKELLVKNGVRTAPIAAVEQQLYTKFINSGEWWNVDMIEVRGRAI